MHAYGCHASSSGLHVLSLLPLQLSRVDSLLPPKLELGSMAQVQKSSLVSVEVRERVSREGDEKGKLEGTERCERQMREQRIEHACQRGP